MVDWERKKRRARAKRLRNRILLPAVRAGIFLLSLLPLEAASRLGEAIGRVAFHLLAGDRRTALDNLTRSLGDRRSPAEIRGIALDTFRNLGACALEWLVLQRRGPEAACATVRATRGVEHLEAARARGRGVLVVTGHFGLFELMPVHVIRLGFSGKVVGRRPTDEAFEGLIVDRRKRMGVETIPQQQPREILRVLRRGEVVGILPDQDLDKLPGIFVPFFGRPAYTVTGPATLAVTFGSSIVPAFMYRDGPGRHRLEILPPVEDPGGDDREERIRVITERVNAVLEREIAAAPTQWAWIHRRWATTPETLARRQARRAHREARRTRKRMRGRAPA